MNRKHWSPLQKYFMWPLIVDFAVGSNWSEKIPSRVSISNSLELIRIILFGWGIIFTWRSINLSHLLSANSTHRMPTATHQHKTCSKSSNLVQHIWCIEHKNRRNRYCIHVILSILQIYFSVYGTSRGYFSIYGF